jgi:hypothetical protein
MMLERKDEGGEWIQTALFPKLALCLVMHSSYISAVQGANFRGSFATLSRTETGATSLVIFL